MLHTELILILDFGSQYTQLIARKVRECCVYAEIHPYNITIDKIKSLKPIGIIFSGGPSSVYEENAPHSSNQIFDLGIPILGICYGLQLIAYQNEGEVNRSYKREFGRAELIIDDYECKLFKGLQNNNTVWMSHGDSLTKIPSGFTIAAHSDNAPICVITNAKIFMEFNFILKFTILLMEK